MSFSSLPKSKPCRPGQSALEWACPQWKRKTSDGQVQTPSFPVRALQHCGAAELRSTYRKAKRERPLETAGSGEKLSSALRRKLPRLSRRRDKHWRIHFYARPALSRDHSSRRVAQDYGGGRPRDYHARVLEGKRRRA